MAKIAEYLKQILSARYGRDVRQSIHDAISAINDESTECWATVEKVPETLAIAAVKDRVSGKDVTLPMSSDFVATDFKAGGNTEQDTTSGKNLLQNTATDTQINGLAYTIQNDGSIKVVGKTTVADYQLLIGQVDLPAGSYILSGGINSISKLRIAKGTNDSFLGHDEGKGFSFTLEEPSTVFVSIRTQSAVGTSVNVVYYPMIRLATITDGTYEPFTNGASPNPSYPQEIKSVVLSGIKTCWKNLANYQNDNNRDKSGFNYTTETPEKIVATKKVSGGVFVTRHIANLKANTQYCASLAENIYSIYVYYDELWGNVWKTFANTNNFTFTPPKDGTYVIGVYVSSAFSTGSEITVSNFMIEQGTTATPYEPYTESVATLSKPITLNGLNRGQDYVDVKRGVEHYAIGKYTVTSKDGFTSRNNYITIKVDNVKSYGTSGVATSDVLAISNYFVGRSWGYNKDESVFPYWKESVIAFKTTMTLTEFRAFVAEKETEGKPLEVYFILAEPIETPLPDADVEALKNIRTFKGTTHIFTDSEVKPDLEVEYVIDTKLYIDAKIAELA